MSNDERKFVLDFGWRIIVSDLGLSEQSVLHRAKLPPDFLSRKTPSLTSEEYFRFWGAMIELSGQPDLPLHLVDSITVETFSPPILAVLSSTDLNAALKRLADYKPLVGPLELRINQTGKQTTVVVEGIIDSPGSELVVAAELAFLVKISRLATRKKIVPLKVRTAVTIPKRKTYEKFFGTGIDQSRSNAVVFSGADAELPFLTANTTIQRVLEPVLKTQLADLENNRSYCQRVRVCITEALSSGDLSINSIAKRLAVGSRTLQRRLADEGTSFQQELGQIRWELAEYYLASTKYSVTDIAFLLGYQDPNSFYRAFHNWTGQTPEVVRLKASNDR